MSPLPSLLDMQDSEGEAVSQIDEDILSVEKSSETKYSTVALAHARRASFVSRAA